jgi:hypothetical protein
MARIAWPTIEANKSVLSPFLDLLLPAGMAARTQGLQLAEDEAVRVVMVWLDVIADGCWLHHTAGKAYGA